MKQKTIGQKPPGKIGSLAAAVAFALPLYAGCVKKDTTPPASQPSGYTEMKRTAPKKMEMTLTLISATPIKQNMVDRAVADAYRKAASSQPASAPKPSESCPEDVSGFSSHRIVAVIQNGVHYQKTYSVAEGSTVYIEGHGTHIGLSITRVGEKNVVVKNLVNNKTTTMSYRSEIMLRGKVGFARVKLEPVEKKCIVNLTVTQLGLTCNHLILPAFNIFIIGRSKQTLLVKAGDKIDTCLDEKITVSEVDRRGITLAGFGLLQYGKILRIGEAALIAVIKAEKGISKGTAMVTVICPAAQQMNFQTKP